MSRSSESAIQFPCTFPIKAMGLSQHDIEGIVRKVIRLHADASAENTLRQKHSNGGKYVSITFTVQAQNQEQLDSLYRELSSHEEIVMVL